MTICNFCDIDTTKSSDQTVFDLPEGVPPLYAFYLYLSSSCNLRCKHCWVTPKFDKGVPLPGNIIEPEALYQAVQEGKKLGLCSAKLTGGEPMLHPQFKEIVDMLTRQGLSLNMETNGTLMNREMAGYLKNHTNLNSISISLDSSNPNEHDAFRGVAGAFSRTLHGLDVLVEAGYSNCQVIMAVHRENRHQMQDLVLLAQNHGAGSVKFNPVTKTGRGVQMHERGEVLEYDELIDLAHYVNDELRPSVNIPVIFPMPLALTPFDELWQSGYGACDCGVTGILGVLGSGEIALCGIGETVPDLIYGRIGKDSIRDIWVNNPTINNLRRDIKDIGKYPGVCKSCIHANACRTGCVANNYGYWGKLIAPSWLCHQASITGKFPVTRLKNERDQQN